VAEATVINLPLRAEGRKKLLITFNHSPVSNSGGGLA